jgi:hypothetical protein
VHEPDELKTEGVPGQPGEYSAPSGGMRALDPRLRQSSDMKAHKLLPSTCGLGKPFSVIYSIREYFYI